MMTVSAVCVFGVVMFSLLAGAPAQRSPYAGSSDPGVLPQYLPEADNRFGDGGVNNGPQPTKQPPKIQPGTLEHEDLYNRVSSWPDDHKPFWYLNAAAIQKQREQQQQLQQQQQQQAAQAQGNRRPGFASRPRPN